ncbi:MAG: PilZ domain-containing protein [Phycisphaerales bacterium]
MTTRLLSFRLNRSEERRGGRLTTRGLRCSLGRVVDLSSSGLRVIHSGFSPRGEGARTITIYADIGPIRVQARIVRRTRTGLFRQELGLEFVNLDPAMRQQLLAVFRSAMKNTSVADLAA